MVQPQVPNENILLYRNYSTENQENIPPVQQVSNTPPPSDDEDTLPPSSSPEWIRRAREAMRERESRRRQREYLTRVLSVEDIRGGVIENTREERIINRAMTQPTFNISNTSLFSNDSFLDDPNSNVNY